jgi:hypothetical protein
VTKFAILILIVALGFTAFSQPLVLSPGTQLELADEAAAAKLLGTADAYFQRMSAFDRAVRMRSAETPSLEAFARNAAQSARAFTDAEREKVESAWAEAKPLLENLRLAFPKRITLVKTNGREDINEPYCRGPVIVIPEKVFTMPPGALVTTLLHELFHIFSTNHPELRDRLYALLDYRPCSEVALPPGEDARRFTNPDAMFYNYYTVIQHEGREIAVTPLMLSRAEKYDPAARGGAFSQVSLLLVELTVRAGQATPVLDSEGRITAHEADKVPAFLQRMQRNTGYIIHPEEVLADNFVHAAKKTAGLPEPDLPSKLLEIMQSAKPR